MKLENPPIRRPLFDAPVYPGEESLSQEQRGIPSPSNSLFATPEGKALTFGPDAYARYITTPPKERKPLMHALASELVAHPSYVNSFFSFGSEHYDENTKSLTPELIHTLPEIIKKSGSLSERQARELLTLAVSGDNKRQLFATHILREYVNATSNIDPSSESVTVRALQETQSRIVDLLYTLAVAGLEMKNRDAYKYIFEIISFQTPALTDKDLQAALYAISGQSPNNDTLGKAVLLDQTAGLLEHMFAEQGNYVVALNSAIKNSERFTKPYIAHNVQDEERRLKLSDFFEHRYQTFGTSFEEGNVDINRFYTDSLPFPENLIFVQNQKMWPLFLDLCSDVLLLEDRIKSPITQFSLPDGSLRHIAAVDGGGESLVKNVIAYALNETHFPPEVYEKKVIESFLRFTTPEIPEQNIPEMKRVLLEKKHALDLPVRGINQSGVEILYGNNHHIAATSLSIDQSGRSISLKMGNYTVHLQLNQSHELVDTEGHPLDLPENARIWWETVVLAPLKELVCPTREDGVLVTGTEDLTPAEALLKTKKVLLTRIGFLRRLPPGKCFTPEQSNKTLEVLYPLPGIEKLDLAELNKSLGYTKDEGQYTYVLPLEKEKKDALPLSIHTPHAFDDVAKYMG